MMRFRTVLLSTLSLAATLYSVPGFAQAAATEASAQPPEIVVTAQRRSERSRDVPISVTTLNPQQLSTANVTSLSDITKLTPAMRFDAAGSNVQPSIRGVGTAIATSGAGPNVGIYVDGFFQSNPAVADFQLLKVQNIQVLEGPQGTLFGRNTTGGAILVTTADPNTNSSGELKLGYGSFNAITAQGYATFGLGKDVAMDVEGIFHAGDGYVRNLTPNVGDGKFKNWSVRTGLKANVASNVSVLLRYTHSSTDDPSPLLTSATVDSSGGANYLSQVSSAGRAIYGANNTIGKALIYYYTPAAYFATAPGTINSSEKPVFTNVSDSVQGTIKADLGFANLTSYTQYRHDNAVNRQELGESAFPAFYIYIGVNDSTLSQEFLLSSKAGTPLQWTAGVNYFQNRDTWDVRASLGGTAEGPFGGSTTTTKSTAAFADLTYQVTDQLFLTAGGRYSHDVVGDATFKTNLFTQSYTGPTGQTIPFSGPAGSVIGVNDLTNDSFTPRAVIRYKPSKESSIYASYTRGFKAGILNVGGLSQQPVKPETINAFETGYKFDNRIFSLDLAAFYYDYKNLQVSSYQFGAAIINNAASSEIYGLEAQLGYHVSKDFSLNASGAYTHARYKSFPGAPYYNYCDPAATSFANPLYCFQGAGTLAQTSIDASGYHVQRSPDFTATLGAQYGLDLARGRMTLSGNLYYTSSFYFDPVQQFKQNGYAVASLRAQWVDPSKHFTIAVFGDNLTNQRYKTQVLANTVGVGNTWSPPATWGASVSTKF